MYSISRLVAFGYAFLVLGMAGLYLGDKPTRIALGQEDQIVEYTSAVLYLVAAAFVFRAYLSSGPANHSFFGVSTGRNVWLLLLALFFVFCCGEEISWGQRILGWSTPEIWKEVNGHGETNLHNLLDHGPLGLTADRAFALIWLLYCVIVPLIDRFVEIGRRFFKWIGLPVPTLVAGGLFLLIFIAFRYAMLGHTDNTPETKSFREWRELGYAGSYLVVAIAFYLKERYE